MDEEGLPKKATLVQRPKAGDEGNYVKIWEKSVTGRGNLVQRLRFGGMSFVYWSNRKAIGAGAA